MRACRFRVPMAASGLRGVLDQGFVHAKLAGAARHRAAARADRRALAVRHRGRAADAVGVSALPPFHQSVDDGGRRRRPRRRRATPRSTAIAHLPQVPQARAYAAFYVAPWVDGSPISRQNFEAIGSIDGRYFDQDRFTPIKGRAARPGAGRRGRRQRGERARRYGYHVGQTIDFGTVSRDDVENARSPDELNDAAAPPADPRDDRRRRCLHRRGRAGRHRPIAARAVHARLRARGEGPRALRVARPRAAQRRRRRRRGQADDHRAVGGGGPQIFRVTSTDTFHARAGDAVRCRSPSAIVRDHRRARGPRPGRPGARPAHPR